MTKWILGLNLYETGQIHDLHGAKMKDENVLKTPQLLTRSKHTRPEAEITIEVTDEDGPCNPRVHSITGRDVFGWKLPQVENGVTQKNVIDLKWLNDYNDEIDQLQVVIKKERSLSFNSESGDLLGSLRPSSKIEGSELEESLNSTHSFEIDLPDQSLLQTTSGQREFLKSDHFQLQISNEEIRSTTPMADVLCSMRSCPSRDSGISALDEISDNFSEVHLDHSLFAELECVSKEEDDESACVKVSPSSTKCKLSLSEQNSLNETKCDPEIQSLDRKCPAWYKKFSMGQKDFVLNFNTLNWGMEPEFEEGLGLLTFGKDEQYDSLLSKSDKDSSSYECVDDVENIDCKRRQSLKDLWSVCDKLEASSLRKGQAIKGLPEIMELVSSLSKLDNRLEILKCDLQSLSRQATEHRHEFNGLHKKTSTLIASTESSRFHMSQLFCLERLEERLQEEWWGAHYPDLLKLEENYMV